MAGFVLDALHLSSWEFLSMVNGASFKHWFFAMYLFEDTLSWGCQVLVGANALNVLTGVRRQVFTAQQHQIEIGSSIINWENTIGCVWPRWCFAHIDKLLCGTLSRSLMVSFWCSTLKWCSDWLIRSYVGCVENRFTVASIIWELLRSVINTWAFWDRLD